MPEDQPDLLNAAIAGVIPGGQGDSDPAEQGDAPADLSERPAPPVPTPSRAGLSAGEVARLSGGDEGAVDANNALERAEGVVPDDES